MKRVLHRTAKINKEQENVMDDRLIRLSQILTIAANDEEFALRGKKYQTFWIFSSWPREANFSPKLRRTREQTAELTAQLFLHVYGELKSCSALEERAGQTTLRGIARQSAQLFPQT